MTKSGVRQTQTADLQIADLQTCRLADLQTRSELTGGGGDNCPRRDLAQRAKSKYLQLKYTVSMPEKILICLNRGLEESVGNDDVMKTENSEGTA